jgi:hypothetical protein
MKHAQMVMDITLKFVLAVLIVLIGFHTSSLIAHNKELMISTQALIISHEAVTKENKELNEQQVKLLRANKAMLEELLSRTKESK